MYLELKGQNLYLTVLNFKFTYFADQTGPKGDPMKMNFDNFQIQN